MSRGGRGRGKGKGSQLSFNVEAVGFGRGDPLPGPVLQPPPLYPPLRNRPNCLIHDSMEIINIKERFLTAIQDSPYYIKEQVKAVGIKRYSDKYRTKIQSDATVGWQPDWKRFPAELKMNVKKSSKTIRPVKSTEDVVKHLEKLEKQDQLEEGEDTKKDDKEGASEEDEIIQDDAVADDEVYEEENDYLSSYFDGGEDFIDDDEDALEDKDGGIY